MTSPFPHVRRLATRLGILLCGLVLPCCGPSGDVAISRKRVLPEKEQKPRTGVGSEERFRLALSMAGFGGQQPQKPRDAQPRLAWDMPEGWKAVTGSAMRQADLRFGESSEGECYVMRAGGSLADNANRWRQQMGLPPISEEEVAKLPKRPLFGMEAYFVALDGDYTGMGSAGAGKDYRMLGVILPMPDVSLFVKMVGPRADVTANEAKFQAFCDSLRIENP